MGQTTITVSEQTLERFKSLKAELNEQQGPPDQTNESFLHALMDTWEAASNGYYDDDRDDVTHMAEQLDRLESSASTIEERTGRIEQTLEDMGARR